MKGTFSVGEGKRTLTVLDNFSAKWTIMIYTVSPVLKMGWAVMLLKTQPILV